MNRIASVLAVTAGIFLTISTVTGACLLTGNIHDPDDQTAFRFMSIHRLAGIGGGVIILLVNSIVVTYFIGTSRWIKEVCDTYRLADDFSDRSTRLKRQTFPASLVSMLTILGIATLGGIADPMASVRLAPPEGISWGTLHLLAVCFGVLLMGYCYVVQRRNILTNQAIITAVVDEVQQVRVARGLDQPTAEKL
ncbi:MAG: hypothetical protein JSS27_18935 [Planctomycetes bacterium]|nr:hypothetical protein [Planctomycetota bacterium]